MLIDNGDGTHTVRIDIIVKDAILEKKGIELFAHHFGWRPMIHNDQGQEVANPETALDAGIRAIKKLAGDIFKDELMRSEAQKAQEAAAAEADSLLQG
jgi:hypothetical protein